MAQFVRSFKWTKVPERIEIAGQDCDLHGAEVAKTGETFGFVRYSHGEMRLVLYIDEAASGEVSEFGYPDVNGERLDDMIEGMLKALLKPYLDGEKASK